MKLDVRVRHIQRLYGGTFPPLAFNEWKSTCPVKAVPALRVLCKRKEGQRTTSIWARRGHSQRVRDMAMPQDNKKAPAFRRGFFARSSCDQRFENWKLFRAFARPYFFRSTTRLSRVRKPAAFSAPRSDGS